MKKDKKTINMVEETFFSKHGKKLFVTVTVITGAGLIYIAKKHDIELSGLKDKLAEAGGMALRSLRREKSDAEFEIKQLTDYINNLDHDIKINIFENIPKAEARIRELELFIEEINKDIARIRD